MHRSQDRDDLKPHEMFLIGIRSEAVLRQRYGTESKNILQVCNSHDLAINDRYLDGLAS